MNIKKKCVNTVGGVNAALEGF